MININLEKIKNKILDFVFPRHCVICDAVLPFGNGLESKHLCSDCKKHFKEIFLFINEPTCKKCGAMINDEEELYCDRCKNKLYESFNYGFGLLRYNDFIKESLHRIKYNGRKEYLEFYGKYIAKAFYEKIKSINPDCFVPVPIHKNRLRERNYNQAAVLSYAISDELKKYNINIPVNEKIIFRRKNTVPLNKLSEDERSKQIKNAFITNEDKNIKSVIIVDDIYTSGNTINEMAISLKNIGVEKIYFITIVVVDNI